MLWSFKMSFQCVSPCLEAAEPRRRCCRSAFDLHLSQPIRGWPDQSTLFEEKEAGATKTWYICKLVNDCVKRPHRLFSSSARLTLASWGETKARHEASTHMLCWGATQQQQKAACLFQLEPLPFTNVFYGQFSVGHEKYIFNVYFIFIHFSEEILFWRIMKT